MNNVSSQLDINEEERIKVEKILREHWKDESICLIELIRAEYDDENKQIDQLHGGINEAENLKIQQECPANRIHKIYKTNNDEHLSYSEDNRGEFFVIIDYDLDLDWSVGDIIDKDLFEKIVSEVSIVKSIPHTTLSPEQKLTFMRLLGNALVAAIKDQSAEAEKLVTEARLYVLNRLSEYSRSWTLSTATIVLLLILVIYLLSVWDAGVAENPRWLYGSIWGGIGAYFSIAFKAGKEQRDAEAGKLLHILNVVVKFLCAMIMGCLGYFLLENGHFLPYAISEIGKNENGALVIGFMCGFCEKLIPNLITSLSQEK